MKWNRTINYIALSLGVLLVVSCSNTKFLEEDQQLYIGAEIDIIGDSLTKQEKTALENQLTSDLTPKPNSSFLGLRPKLYIYNTTKEPKKQKGYRYWKKYKLGEPPVLLSDVDIEFNRDLIENHSENKGYFNVTSSYDVEEKNQKAKVIYRVEPKTRYIISKVSFPADSTIINKEIQKVKDKSLLKIGKPFDLDVIVSERNRIDNHLKENGFYYFHPDNIIVQADSTVQRNQVELIVRLKDDMPRIAANQYTIDQVRVYADYQLGNRGGGSGRRNRDERSAEAGQGSYSVDTLSPYKNLFVVDPENKFKRSIYDRTLYFEKGDLYNRTDHNLSLQRLNGLGTFKFVKNQFIVSDSINNKMDVYYMLTPNNFKSLRFELLGKTNSANFAGSEINVNWNHRNFLRGAEMFTASIYGAFDFQMGGRQELGNNIYRTGAKFSLTFPRLIAPFEFRSSSAYVPRTRVELGYEYLQRTNLYSLHSFNTSFGYLWKENSRKEHELKLIDVLYVAPGLITDEFQATADRNRAFARIVERQLMFGPSYNFNYTNTMLPRRHTFLYNGKIEFSGNITGLLTGANYKEDNTKSLFGVPFSQYVKTEHDIRHYMKLGGKSMWASRFIAGIAVPYGNLPHMPFAKQFFSGGVNSIRAFRARTVGPGSYDLRSDEQSTFLFDQAGDIKLEFSTEYRANLFSFLNAAVFVDAGNVWLLNEDEDKPGAKFSSDFMSEIAVGAGVGLRFDFSILILRTDLAIPLRVPYYDKSERWRINAMDFGDPNWRRDNLILNIAIGYPF